MKCGSSSIAILCLASSVLAQGQEVLSIAAASDLAGVSKALSEAFEKQQGRKVKVRFTLGSSGILARQIENGAPFDVFLSANERYVVDLARSGRIEGFTTRAYASGVVGLWSLDGKITTLEALTKARTIALANPAHAPYGVAAKEALEKLDLWTRLKPKIVFGENVRQALQYAESGNADAVVTAWPLILGKPGAVRIPASLHQPIRQIGGIVKGSRRGEQAEAFLQFLTKGGGAAILESGGFQKP